MIQECNNTRELLMAIKIVKPNNKHPSRAFLIFLPSVTISNQLQKGAKTCVRKEKYHKQSIPYFRDSRFSYGPFRIFATTMGKLQRFIQPPQTSCAIPPTMLSKKVHLLPVYTYFKMLAKATDWIGGFNKVGDCIN